jgi:hypothetical protein
MGITKNEKEKKEIRIIKKEHIKEEYTFVSDNFLNNVKNESTVNEQKVCK